VDSRLGKGPRPPEIEKEATGVLHEQKKKKRDNPRTGGKTRPIPLGKKAWPKGKIVRTGKERKEERNP